MIILDNVKVGDKFSNETKLLVRLGFTNNKDNSKKANIKEAQCYLSYEKTGKISRGKVTNEIIITEIFSTPLDKVDLRVNNGGARDGYNYNFNYLFDTMAYIMADNRTNSVTGTHSYTMKDLYTRYGLLDDDRNILNNNSDCVVIDDYESWNKQNEIITHNKYVAEVRNKFRGTFLLSMERVNKTGDIFINENYFVYFEYENRELANDYYTKAIADSELKAFNELLDTDDNRELLTKKAHKKFEKNPNYKLSSSDLFTDFSLQNQYWQLSNEIFKNKTGLNYCKCYTFELNKQRDDLINKGDFELEKFDVQFSIKDSFRKWSIIQIMIKGKQLLQETDERKSVIDYLYRNKWYIKTKHEAIFGKEDWKKYNDFRTKQDFKDNLEIFNTDVDDENIFGDEDNPFND